jgi:hypothetical protein
MTFTADRSVGQSRTRRDAGIDAEGIKAAIPDLRFTTNEGPSTT